jgi:hypothetical protein
MRKLIDAEKLKEHFTTAGYLPRFIRESIDVQPTAYDVDKVIKELEDLKTVKPVGRIGAPKKVTSETVRVIDQAIEIVKRGGIERDWWMREVEGHAER